MLKFNLHLSVLVYHKPTITIYQIVQFAREIQLNWTKYATKIQHLVNLKFSFNLQM